jgi:ferredoxin
MTFVVTADCHSCRFTDCVAACPVDCFHADADMLYIDPLRCIDCGACVPACPVEAIYAEGALPSDQQHWLAINAERAAVLPVLRNVEAPLPGAYERAFRRGQNPFGRL